MFARVSTIKGKPEHIEEVIRFLGKPSPKGLESMKGTDLFVDRKSGKSMTIALCNNIQIREVQFIEESKKRHNLSWSRLLGRTS